MDRRDGTEKESSLPNGVPKLEGYSRWSQTGGYFDGDGCVHVRMDSPVVLRFALVWVDNSYEQLKQLRLFLVSKGVMVGSVLNHSNGVYMLQIASPQAVLTAAKEMVRYCFKKRKELQAAIDYYENKINGTELISRFNELVHSGIRLGKIRPPKQLSTYEEGIAQANYARALKVAGVRKARNSRRLIIVG